MSDSAIIALAGQPNTGKSTVFNSLTGARQHVGNWPGKTVEQKMGSYIHDTCTYTVMDLPGTYSLTANSPEEVIARDYMVSGKADALVVMIDASQLERSLYFLSEIAGLTVPTVVALNMIDVAKEKGIYIDTVALEKVLGVPVIEMVASREIGLDTLKNVLRKTKNEKSNVHGKSLFESYRKNCLEKEKTAFDTIYTGLNGLSVEGYSEEWLTIKFIERDRLVDEMVKKQLSPNDYNDLVKEKDKITYDKMRFAAYRFEWVESLIKATVVAEKKSERKIKRSFFDRLSTHRIWGQPLAIIMILLGFILSMTLCMPIMVGVTGMALPKVSMALIEGLSNMGTPAWLVSLVGEAILPAAVMAFFMVFFVAIVLLVFGVMEDVGYLARVAFVFDRSMCKLGLHGKAIIPFLMSLGCNIAGVTGVRVIDTLRQRRLAIAVSLVVPCLGMWGVISFVSAIFFGAYTPLVILGLFVLTIVHMKLTAWVFGHKVIGMEDEFHGLVMELPPFHKPNWKVIFKGVWYNTKNIIKKAFILIIGISMLMWLLSFSSSGHVEDSLIYGFGKLIEPISMLFGFDWRLFIAFLVSAIGKEAALGVLAMLFGQGGGIMSFTGAMIGGAVSYSEVGFQTAIANGISTASALAFITAFYLNVPCMATIANVRIESGSKSFMWKVVAYYMGSALIIGGLVYRLALFFM